MIWVGWIRARAVEVDLNMRPRPRVGVVLYQSKGHTHTQVQTNTNDNVNTNKSRTYVFLPTKLHSQFENIEYAPSLSQDGNKYSTLEYIARTHVKYGNLAEVSTILGHDNVLNSCHERILSWVWRKSSSETKKKWRVEYYIPGPAPILPNMVMVLAVYSRGQSSWSWQYFPRSFPYCLRNFAFKSTCMVCSKSKDTFIEVEVETVRIRAHRDLSEHIPVRCSKFMSQGHIGRKYCIYIQGIQFSMTWIDLIGLLYGRLNTWVWCMLRTLSCFQTHLWASNGTEACCRVCSRMHLLDEQQCTQYTALWPRAVCSLKKTNWIQVSFNYRIWWLSLPINRNFTTCFSCCSASEVTRDHL